PVGVNQQAPPVRADDNRAEAIRPQYLCTASGERRHHCGAWMAIAVSNADRHQCDTWPYRVEELRAAARRATVMTDLEHVRPERIAIACNKPVLLGSFRITD